MSATLLRGRAAVSLRGRAAVSLRGIAAVWLAVGISSPARAADEGSPTFIEWVNACISEEVAVALSSRSNTKEAETPSISSNPTSLIDTTSASDLLAAALNIAALTAGSGSSGSDEGTSASASVSAYALYSAAAGRDPLSPEFYCQPGFLGGASFWRRISATLGFDDQKNSDGSSPIVAGTKLVLLNNRDVCDRNQFQGIRDALIKATAAASNVFIVVEDGLYARYLAEEKVAGRPPLDKADFLNALQEDKALFDRLRAGLGDDPCNIVASAADIAPFVQLDKNVRDAIGKFERQPQLSAAFLTTQSAGGGADRYRGELSFTYGLNDRLQATANGSYEVVAHSSTEQGGRVAVQLQYQPFRDDLVGPKPLRIALAGQGVWMQGETPSYSGQLRVNLPIPRIQWLTGVEIPLSVTVANRSDLIDETFVRGMIGFTVDTAQVLGALQHAAAR